MSTVPQVEAGNLKSEFESAYSSMDEKQATRRLFEKDSSLWKSDAEQIRKINDRLGWLTLPTNADDLISFSTQIKNEGFKYAVLLGMGGSSLCSEVARETFGSAAGYPELLVLDNTAPSGILN
ncbi:MAG: glucose-6-phosphate isomerase, partial [Bacteroidota bacterium]|nr:glucose-6-phosphate isomerase [Bacteroidota bacterium]